MFLRKQLSKSIAARSSVLISLSALLVMLIIAISVFLSLKHNFNKITKDFMRNETTIIKNLLKQRSGYMHDLYQEIVLEPASNHHGYLARIITDKGKILLQTDSFSKRFRKATWPRIKFDDPTSDIKYFKHGKHHYAIMTTGILLNTPNKHFVYIQLAYNTTMYTKILEHFATTLLIIIFAGILIMIMLLFAAIKIGLSPLNLLSNELSKLDANKLNQKLSANNVPIELQPVVTSFNHLLERINDSVEKIKSFSANIAHELRTPINNLMLQAELTQNKKTIGRRTKKILSDNLEEYAKLSSIIDRLLLLARYDEERMSLKKEQLSCMNEIQKVIDFHSAFSEEKQIDITLNGHDTFIKIDKTLFRNAIANLLTNAIKYNQQGGKIQIIVAKNDHQVEIRIIDNGPGVPPGEIDKVTERFYRVDSHRNSNSAGSGLGLAIVKAIIKIHNGTIIFRNHKPHGLIATIRLPI